MDQELESPAQAGVEPQSDPAAPVRFYVVSLPKFWILYLGTFGLYGIYWTYKHWANFKRATRGDEWPVARAILQVFFVHALLREIDQVLQRADKRFAWNPEPLATTIVVVMLVGGFMDRMGGYWVDESTSLYLSMVLLPVLAYLKQRVQRAANVACDDPDGMTNTKCTAANFAWLTLGAIFWLLLIIGLTLHVKP